MGTPYPFHSSYLRAHGIEHGKKVARGLPQEPARMGRPQWGLQSCLQPSAMCNRTNSFSHFTIILSQYGEETPSKHILPSWLRVAGNVCFPDSIRNPNPAQGYWNTITILSAGSQWNKLLCCAQEIIWYLDLSWSAKINNATI